MIQFTKNKRSAAIAVKYIDIAFVTVTSAAYKIDIAFVYRYRLPPPKEKSMKDGCVVANLKRADNSDKSYLHRHNDYEIIFIEKGSVKVKIEDKEYTAKENSVLLISNLESHSVLPSKEGYNRFVMLLKTRETDDRIASARLLSLFKNHAAEFSHLIDAGENFKSLKLIYDKIADEFYAEKQFRAEYVNALTETLLIELFRLAESDLSFINSPQFNTVCRAQKYLDNHYRENVTVAALAEIFFMDKFYLAHLFKQYTGYSVGKYLLYTRLSRSKYLLTATESAVQEIAVKCGFNDSSNFIRLFKRTYGITPLKFRKEN